jgi:hypothetical protein
MFKPVQSLGVALLGGLTGIARHRRKHGVKVQVRPVRWIKTPPITDLQARCF